ncbi:MAG: Na/Pi symporter, partial [Clostridia bacterium]|nr:Na/Pi symporter [Clostridia bacterium]
MFGMETMSGAVSGLRDVPGFRNLFLMFQNPVLGVLAGAVLTAIIQSSSASVGILQALAVTGQVSFGAAIPIIMGQNIGTCVTAMLSAIGANKNAKRAAMVHLSFNVIGTLVWLTVFCLVKAIFAPAILGEAATLLGIAVAHSVFNVLCTVLMLPMSSLLEQLVCRIVPDDKKPEVVSELDERLLTTPPVALARCKEVAEDMANCAVAAMKQSIASLKEYTPELGAEVRRLEDKTDHYEDILGTYLVKLSTRRISRDDSNEAAKLLKVIGDFERIGDHAVGIVASAEELSRKELALSAQARAELAVLENAVNEILDLALEAFLKDDYRAAGMVEPLEQVIDELKESLRTAHILRLQREACSIEAGFVWSDLLTCLERVSDHCSNIAGCITDMHEGNLHLHESLRAVKNNREDYEERYDNFRRKYALPGGAEA